MPWRERGALPILLVAVAILGMIFLMVPILVIFPLSIDTSPMLRFPPRGFTLRWYQEYLTSESWLDATFLSLRVATLASLIATMAGTLAAIGMHRTRVPGRRLISIVLIAPVLLPLVVVAIAIYNIYAVLGLIGTQFGIALAHSVLAIPFVLLNVNAALQAIPRSYDEAALSLGAGPLAAARIVTLPLIWRGVAAGAVFAFVISFDEVVIAMFLSSVSTTTLPKKMLDGIFFDLSPVLAAITKPVIGEIHRQDFFVEPVTVIPLIMQLADRDAAVTSLLRPMTPALRRTVPRLAVVPATELVNVASGSKTGA